MIAVVQRVSKGSVVVANEVVGAVDLGFVVLLGVAHEDGNAEVEYLARRIAELRVFEDEAGRMNRALADVGGTVLAVPQFTLLAGLKKGRRPDFLAAAKPEKASERFDQFVLQLRDQGVPVETGRFGANMQVSLTNMGPATFLFDTRVLMEA
jgi:D-tyrosyl-tRNA(Tyr) deacylase